jgi:protein-histidine pros-kinase
MRLIVKFNLVLALVFVIAFGLTGLFTHALLERNAKAEIEENARIMIEGARAIRTYTSTQINPLLKTQLTYAFMPQSVAAYSANEYFKQLRKKYPDYSYREATLNPTNPSDRATDWEADIVRHFRDNPEQKELVNERDTPVGRALFIAMPLKVPSPACLECHDTAERAPRTVVERYGSSNGFGWKVDDIVAAQIVSAPMRLPIQRANQAFIAFMLSFALVFFVLVIAINALLLFLVIRPVKKLSDLAIEASLGNLDTADFSFSGKDEVATLAESFKRMRNSLVRAMTMLEGGAGDTTVIE